MSVVPPGVDSGLLVRAESGNLNAIALRTIWKRVRPCALRYSIQQDTRYEPSHLVTYNIPTAIASVGGLVSRARP